jgi:hypothetical protein
LKTICLNKKFLNLNASNQNKSFLSLNVFKQNKKFLRLKPVKQHLMKEKMILLKDVFTTQQNKIFTFNKQNKRN